MVNEIEQEHQVNNINWRRVFSKSNYLEGATEWFNPLSTKPHPLLERRLPNSEQFSIDMPLKLFGITRETVKSYIDLTTGKKPSNLITNFIRITYSVIIDAFILANISRTLIILWLDDIRCHLYLGNASVLWIRRPVALGIPLIMIQSAALFTNVLFQRLSADSRKSWYFPFAIFTGQITPLNASLRSLHQLEKMSRVSYRSTCVVNVVTVIWGSLYTFLHFRSILNYPEKSLIGTTSIYWSIINCFSVIYSIASLVSSTGYFFMLSYYLRLRFKRVNKITYALLEPSPSTIPLGKKAAFLGQVIYEHGTTCRDLAKFNEFWKHWLGIMLILYVPLTFWLLHVALFVSASCTMAKVIIWLFLLQVELNILSILYSGEMVAYQSFLSYRWMNALCLHPYPVALAIKLAETIERLGSQRIGFSCWDFFVINKQTYYELAVMLGTQFFLVADFVLSYM